MSQMIFLKRDVESAGRREEGGEGKKGGKLISERAFRSKERERYITLPTGSRLVVRKMRRTKYFILHPCVLSSNRTLPISFVSRVTK